MITGRTVWYVAGSTAIDLASIVMWTRLDSTLSRVLVHSIDWDDNEDDYSAIEYVVQTSTFENVYSAYLSNATGIDFSEIEDSQYVAVLSAFA